jgi:hypothetical protein
MKERYIDPFIYLAKVYIRKKDYNEAIKAV